MQCSVLHIATLETVTHNHELLIQATRQCFELLISRIWSRGQIILSLSPAKPYRKPSHIIIDLNADGSWAVDDRVSRNSPVVLNFGHMPKLVSGVQAFFYSPSAQRFVDESEHDGRFCRQATEWDEDSKLFIYSQNIDVVQH